MNLLQSLILGIIEGLTEFLPVSSTAHLLLAGHWLGVEPSPFQKTFDIAIQSGAILAVLAFYGKMLLRTPRVWGRVLAGFVPTAIIGVTFYPSFKNLLGDPHVALAALFLGGVGLIVFEKFHKENDQPMGVAEIPYRTCVIIGLCQSLALVPGVSRAAATIIGGLALGLNRKTIVEFSFLLAIPTILAASGLELMKNTSAVTENLLPLAVGTGVSFVFAFLSIRFFLRFIESNRFTIFGLYRVVFAALCWSFLPH